MGKKWLWIQQDVKYLGLFRVKEDDLDDQGRDAFNLKGPSALNASLVRTNRRSSKYKVPVAR